MASNTEHATLVICDLDGTLISVFEYHVRCLDKVVAEVWGIENQLPVHQRFGIPQRETLRRICEIGGVPRPVYEQRLGLAMQRLAHEMSASLPAELSSYLLPGAIELLNKLQIKPATYLALATGTIGPTAEIILARSGLKPYFPVAVFGHESNTRSDLMRLAIERSIGYYGIDREDMQVITIGDAPSDIEAGKAIGALIVAVASGKVSTLVLSQYNPDVLLDDFSDVDIAFRSIFRTNAQ